MKLPVIVRVDNVGTIFMGTNATTSSRTRHIECCTKYVQEYQEDGVAKIIFVKSESNILDIMTKNIQGNLYDKHSSELVIPKF